MNVHFFMMKQQVAATWHKNGVDMCVGSARMGSARVRACILQKLHCFLLHASMLPLVHCSPSGYPPSGNLHVKRTLWEMPFCSHLGGRLFEG